MGYKRGHESESLAEISRALRAGLQADAQASTPLSQHVQPEEPALAAPASKRKRKKPAAESARTGDPAKEAVKVKIAKKNRPPSAALDAALPGVTVEAARDLNDASIGNLFSTSLCTYRHMADGIVFIASAQQAASATSGSSLLTCCRGT